MGFLSLFQKKPRWQHRRPKVRLAAIRELDDQSILTAIAEGDNL
jgi:hypothetical protein